MAASLFRLHPSMVQPSPHQEATYLGDGVWQIMGANYSSDITLWGGGSPSVGQAYPCSFRDPDNWRHPLIHVPLVTRLRRKGDGLPKFFAGWWRLGVRMACRYFQGAWDDPEEFDSSIVLSGTGLSAAAGILRTHDDGTLWWSDSDLIKTRNLGSGETTSVDAGGEITSLALDETTGICLFTMGSYVNSEEGECGAGAAAAILAAEGTSAIAQAVEDCTNVAGYNAQEYAELALAANPPDEEQSETYKGCYNDAFLVKYIEIYRTAYISSGCEAPEE